MASRSETSRKAILEATSELLAETTVQKLSIEAIAKRAGVGKTTIYRWWPSKAAVVIDAFIEHHLVHTPIRDDVRCARPCATPSSLIQQYAGPQGRLVAQIIAESQYDESTLPSSASASGTAGAPRRGASSSAAYATVTCATTSIPG